MARKKIRVEIKREKDGIAASQVNHDMIVGFHRREIEKIQSKCPHPQKTYHMGAFPGEGYHECVDCGWRDDE